MLKKRPLVPSQDNEEVRKKNPKTENEQDLIGILIY